MIIKSMSRKDPSFDQLTAYMLATDGAEIDVRHNFPASNTSPDDMIAEFQKEHALLPFRVNGNALFHEILALEPNTDVPVKQQIKALRVLAERYLERRAPLQLAIGVIHASTAHIHMHLMISSNALYSRRRISLPKAEFAEIKREIENYRIQQFPELGSKRVFDQPKKERTHTVREQAGRLRSGKPSHKDELAASLATILQKTRSRETLDTALAKLGLTLYQRGRSIGVQTEGGRRYRLRTLDLTQDYTDAVTRFELAESRLASLKQNRSRRTPEREREN